jgi:hypothetical protein
MRASRHSCAPVMWLCAWIAPWLAPRAHYDPPQGFREGRPTGIEARITGHEPAVR